ncbi:MAG: DUF421 domain-containing protein [Oscillospiraceae bacterium]|nr:DUF421 domain-containing protein [Oscillospiraceae bacterium]
MIILIIRTFILYILVIFSVRFMGKRQIGQMQPTELVVTMLISNLATLSLEDTDTPLLIGIIPILFLVSFDVIISIFTLKFRGFRRLVSGTPQIVISNGQVDMKKLKALRMSVDDLLESLRSNSIFDISEVQFAIVETNGKISTYQKAPFRAAEKQDITPDMKQSDIDPPYVIINDGNLLTKGQDAAKLSPKELNNILDSNKTQISDVFLFTCDSNKKYTIIKKNNHKRS